MPDRHIAFHALIILIAILLLAIPRKGDATPVTLFEPLFEETFEDPNWESRGWYDSPRMEITADEHIAGSTHSCIWHWEKTGDVKPRGGGARVHLPPVDNVVLAFHIKHSANWTWTGVPWHPHECHFLTSADHEYVGPSHTHLTIYAEIVNGAPRVAIQDGQNIDETRIEQSLVGTTEARAVAGCNGDSDGHGEGDCYRVGDGHANGKFWEPGQIYFGDEPGPRDKADWHYVKVRLRLNTVADGIGQPDGLLQYSFDGDLIMDHRDIVFRTGQHPDMLIDQFLMAPYYGPGVPHPQTIWIDDLRIHTEITPPDKATQIDETDSTWGEVKRQK